MIASNSASSSPNDVSMRQATSGILERISRHTLTPSPSGRRTSSTATSGRSGGNAGQRRLGRTGLADHDDVRFGLQQVTHAFADNLVVVQQEHADHVRQLRREAANGAGDLGPAGQDTGHPALMR